MSDEAVISWKIGPAPAYVGATFAARAVSKSRSSYGKTYIKRCRLLALETIVNTEQSMSDPDIDLKVCPVELFDTVVHSLAELLVASVEGGASVNFILPYTTQEAKAWWIKQRPDIERGSSVLLLALAEEGKKVAGCVILGLAEQPNQPHRADVKKMLVHPDYRRRYVTYTILAKQSPES